MSILAFLGDIEHGPLLDLWTTETEAVPAQPGAYVLLADPGMSFPYPNGKSPVFYIGKSVNLRRRLADHPRYSAEARSDRSLSLYWPRYEYAAAFGCRFVYIRTWQGLSPRALEEISLARFAEHYRSFPVANGSGSWSRTINPKDQ